MTRARWLAAGVLTSTILKVCLWATVSLRDETGFLRADSGSYIEPARALVRHGVFAISPDRLTVPETVRTPGYPLFLAVSFRLFGERVPPAVLLQIGLSVLVVATFYRFSRLQWGSAVAMVAAGLLILDLASLAHTLLVSTETLFTLVLLIALLTIAAVLDERRSLAALSRSAAAGLLLAAATFTRPVTYYLAPPVALGLAAALYARGRPRVVTVGGPALVLLAYALPVGGWQARNRRLAGTSEFSSIVGLSMLHYRAAAVVALRDGVSLGEARRRLAPEGSFATARERPHLRLGERWRQRGSRIVADHPALLARVQAAGAMRMMGGPGVGDLVALLGDASQRQAAVEETVGVVTRRQLVRRLTSSPVAATFSIVAILHLIIIYAGVGVWAWLVARRRIRVRAPDVLVFGVVLYLALTQAGPEAYARMRVPMMPLLAALAAIGFTEVRPTRRRAGFTPTGSPSA
jgi:4-amino-4-deoxy-L-arabinose transferase-like glycosyltransferase